MGYTIRQIASRFTLPSSQQRKAFQALRRLDKKTPLGLDPLDPLTLDRIVQVWDFIPTIDATTGDWTDLRFTGDKLLAEHRLILAALARFIRPGSYLEMQGEDGQRWRWVFNGRTCIMEFPRITWPSDS